MVDFAVRFEPTEPPYDAERARAFAAAARHSALVRLLRVAIFGGAVGTVAVLVAIAVFDPFGRLAHDVSVAGLGLDGSKVLMDKPKLSGFRKDGRPYLVNAQKAIQDVLHPTLVELRGIDGEMGLAANGAAHMTADTGLYDTANEHMDVTGNVRIKSEQYDVTARSGSIDFKSGVYISKEPVTVVTSNGATVSADSVSATDNGHLLTFVGRVRSTLQPQDQNASTSAQLKGTNP
ncbi:MAG TPA: lipopolysaccharide-assembly, LptC-related protein [Roseiarcus sp.]|nr:lipopolysaccharide-assembly, LptC-related protein [Roseiarcus sp.]